MKSALATGLVGFGPFLSRGQSPNEKLNIGCIGVGNQGASNLNSLSSADVSPLCNIVALCDIDEKSLNAASAKFPNAKKHRDFRRLLEQKDIDAVLIATPDHFHAVAAMAAIKLGKHVYCEKPLTHSIYEARQLALAARAHKVATQMGNSGHSSEGTRQVVEWIQAGVIGAVREVHTWSNRPIWPQGIARPTDMPAVPPTVDWDLWLGPAPARPYHPAYHPFKWRGWWDFGTGALGDMGCHIIDSAFWALSLDQPISVEAESSAVNEETAPSWSIVRFEFLARGNNPPCKLIWYDGGKQPSPELTETPAGQKLEDNGALFIGDKGKIYFPRRSPQLLPASAMKDFTPPPKILPRSTGHHKEWVEACKGGRPAGSNFDFAGPLTELVLLGNAALRVGHKIHWDGVNLKVLNAPEAARFIRREYRAGWSL
jgi:predicted dehydrogenase